MQRSIVWALGALLAVGAGEAAAGAAGAARAEQAAKPERSDKSARAEESERPHVVRRIEVRREHVAGGYLGVNVAEVGRDDVERLRLDAERGARVVAVNQDTPAARAGVQADDVITKFDGEEVRSAAQLRRLVRETPAGRTVVIDLVREGSRQQLSAELGRPPGHDLADGPGFDFTLPEPGDVPDLGDLRDTPAFGWHGGERPRGLAPLLGAPRPQRLGLSYQEISGQLARYFRLEGERGVLVVEVVEDGPAGRAGVKAGDVIVAFDGQPIEDGADLRAALRPTEAGREATLKLWREGRPLELKVTLGGDPRRPRDTT